MQRAVLRQIYAHLARQGLRRTKQRDTLIRLIFDTNDQYSALSLLAEARKIDPTISRATVFRTITVLLESGTLRTVNLGREKTYYEPNLDERLNHSYLICMDCHRQMEFATDRIDQKEGRALQALGFRPP